MLFLLPLISSGGCLSPERFVTTYLKKLGDLPPGHQPCRETFLSSERSRPQRPGHPFRRALHLALLLGLQLLHQDCPGLRLPRFIEPNELGCVDSGPRQCFRVGSAARTEQSRSIWPTGFGLFSGPLHLAAQEYSRHPGPTLQLWVISTAVTPCHTLSPPRRRPESTWSLQGWSSLRSSRRNVRFTDFRVASRIHSQTFGASCRRRTCRRDLAIRCFGGFEKRGGPTPCCPSRLFLRRGTSRRSVPRARRSDWSVICYSCASWDSGRLCKRHPPCSRRGCHGAGRLDRCLKRHFGAFEALQHHRIRAGVCSHVQRRRSKFVPAGRRSGSGGLELDPRCWLRRKSGLLFSGGGGGRSLTYSPISKAESKSKSCFYSRRAKGKYRRQETSPHSRLVGCIDGINPTGPAGHHGSDRQPCPEDFSNGRRRDAPQSVSIAAATWKLEYTWITRCLLEGREPSQGNATAQKFTGQKPSACSSIRCSCFSRRVGGGEGDKCRDELRANFCDAGAVQSVDNSGCTYGLGRWTRRYGSFFPIFFEQGGSWQSEATTGASAASGNLLHGSAAGNGKEDAAGETFGCGSCRSGPQRGHPDSLCGALWGLRQMQRHRCNHVASLHGDGSSSERQCPSCQGQLGSPGCLPRADFARQWENGHRHLDVSSRRPSSEHLYEQVPGGLFKGKGICSVGRSEMDQHCPFLHPRAGPDHLEETRPHRSEGGEGELKSAESEKAAKETGKRRLEKESPRGRRGRGLAHVSSSEGALGGDPADLLSASTTVPVVLASLTRWILSAHTPFSSFLSSSFAVIQCWEKCPATVVFPLPLADFGLFGGVDPKLHGKRFTTLCKKRLRHILIMALNYLHGGLCHRDFHLLGRRPNSSQSQMHQRLWALVTMCDHPGATPIALAPGRSGPEFIARLSELEKFIEENQLFDPRSYSAGPVDYEKKEIGSVAANSSSLPVQPYSSLCAKRLKLVGQGKWPLEKYLEDELWLPFQEPKILHHGFPIDFTKGPNLEAESLEENLQLAKIWDQKNLLFLSRDPPHRGAFSRVFNAYKNSACDRQIGDRRLASATERSCSGPSKSLPGGYLLTSIHVPRSSLVFGSSTDRKDFYHQAAVTRERAMSNLLPFEFLASEFSNTAAMEDFKDAAVRGSTRDRIQFGDFLGQKKKGLLVEDPEEGYVFAGFKSLFQGDHLGVEFALSAHSTLLKRAGLLQDADHIRGRAPFPMSRNYEGLVIDDYFILSVSGRATPAEESESFRRFKVAAAAYADGEVLGSEEKDVVCSRHFKVIGAEVDAPEKALSHGMVLVGAPLEKRIALACLSLRVARLPVISATLASRMAGNWTSVFMYRRCLTCILGKLYDYAQHAGENPSPVFALPRAVADELVLASVFSFVAVSNVAADYLEEVFATDASLQKGAITARKVPRDVAEVLWLGGDKKGSYTKLDHPFREARKILGDELEFDDDEIQVRPGRELPFAFDFVEICAGAASVSKEMARLGHSVCPPIELSDSRHFDLRNLRLIEWIMYMFKAKLFLSTMVEPVCTTFSPAAHPALRSYAQPLGFNRTEARTLHGNLIAFRCLLILWFASECLCPALGEQPRLSKMAWLSAWRFLCEWKGFRECVVASCQFGSPHRKEFRMLGYGLDMEAMEVKCPGGHSHIPIAGKYTKPSAVYVPELAKHFAKQLSNALLRKRRLEEEQCEVHGLESAVANDILSTGNWRVEAAWFWTHAAHINILESSAYVSLLRRVSLVHGDVRFTALLDSRVAKCSHAKGRSSAKALGPTLRKSAALQISAGLYPALGFAPTRINTADHPTRDRDIPPGSDQSIVDSLSAKRLQVIHSVGLSKHAAGWLRLTILIILVSEAAAEETMVVFAGRTPLSHYLQKYDFGMLLGSLCRFLCIVAAWILALGCAARWRHRTPRWWFLVVSCSLFSFGDEFGDETESHEPQLMPRSNTLLLVAAMPMHPAGTDERSRAERRAAVRLTADRTVLPQTRSKRDKLLLDLAEWLRSKTGESLFVLLDDRETSPETISDLLIEYGKELFYSGKAYGRYSETINAISARRPHLRRQLYGAWDLAFSWVADEPHSHHPAMPLSVLLAFATLSLLWGWPTEASLLLMTWSGLLRIGETLAAQRKDLVLPEDAAPGTTVALLQIRQPKTRGSAAKHQAARIDPVDVIGLLSAVFRNKPRDERLWIYSPSTLRRRFALLQHSLGLPTERSGECTPYDLGSLRAGGATSLLQRFEDAELVRRRGRWLSSRVLEIYLQEINAVTYANRMSAAAFQKIQKLAAAYNDVLRRSINFLHAGIPPALWPHLW